MLLPLFLKLADRTVVVVGAGPVATSKLGALLAAGARVRVVAPDVSDGIERPGVSIKRKPFEPADLDDAWLVVAAAAPEVNRRVAEAAAARRIFVNAVDDPDNASAYLGGVVRKAGVTLAISTGGRAPALAGLLREGFEAVLPEADLARWMAAAERERRSWRDRNVPMEQRRPLLLDALIRQYSGETARTMRGFPAGDGRARQAGER